MKKKIIMLLMAAVLSIGTVACSSGNKNEEAALENIDEGKMKETTAESADETEEETEVVEEENTVEDEESAPENDADETADGIWEGFMLEPGKDMIGKEDESGEPYTIIYKGGFEGDNFVVYGSMSYRSDYSEDKEYVSDEIPHVFRTSEDTKYNDLNVAKISKDEFEELFNDSLSEDYLLGVIVKGGVVTNFYISEVGFAPELDVQNEEADMTQYFFPNGEGEYNYHPWNIMLEETDDDLPVKVELRATYDKGNVYTITIQHEKCPGSTDVDDTDRFRLGSFYVTKDAIYYLRDITDEISPEEDFLNYGEVVCSPTEEEYRIESFEVRIEHDGDSCRYRIWDTAVETGWYCRMVWTKGKGLTYYRSGYGAEAEPIEISLEGTEEEREREL